MLEHRVGAGLEVGDHLGQEPVMLQPGPLAERLDEPGHRGAPLLTGVRHDSQRACMPLASGRLAE
jgi:hypothetical protein